MRMRGKGKIRKFLLGKIYEINKKTNQVLSCGCVCSHIFEYGHLKSIDVFGDLDILYFPLATLLIEMLKRNCILQ